MKTTLWNDVDVRRATPLFARVQEDVTEALAGFDRAVDEAIEADYVDGEVTDALRRLAVVLHELWQLNGSIAFDDGGAIRLAGTDAAGRLAWWKPVRAAWEPV